MNRPKGKARPLPRKPRPRPTYVKKEVTLSKFLPNAACTQFLTYAGARLHTSKYFDLKHHSRSRDIGARQRSIIFAMTIILE